MLIFKCDLRPEMEAVATRPGRRPGSESEQHRVDALFCLGLYGLLGLTYEEIGDRMGVSAKTIQRWCAEARTYASRARHARLESPEELNL